MADAATLANHLRAGAQSRITGDVIIEANQGRFAPLPADLHPGLRQALESRGISSLYSHQAQAWDLVRHQDSNIVVVTPTASGKTLCYNLPVIQSVLQDRTKALYLFPTKALSQDQVAEIIELNKAGDLGVRACTFDGDTPQDARKAVRVSGDIVVSNPDMLHQGILPHHTKWAQFFENLAYVVIDEMHTYRGVFGSHTANVIRRLKRICAFYGSNPRFLLCSATIGNPGELAEALVGEPVVPITESGAPSGEKHLLLWNPPVVNPELGIRASARSQTTRIARKAVENGIKCIVFANTRLMVEVITKYLKDAFDKDPRRTPRVAAYRGGYLPTERRGTEKKLRTGDMDCVVSTSALELGVDIGALDVCILNGYPGTISGTWQRFGRAGRRSRPSLGILVASSAPLDQYVIRNPEFFFASSPEQARVAPDQLLIWMDHVRCAAFELPFSDGEQFGGGGENLAEALAYLAEEGLLHHEQGRWHWMADSYPANGVSLRSTAEGNFLVIDITDGKKQVIAEVDYSAAAMTVYEQAIYMVQASPWQVEKLDWDGRKAYVRRCNSDYYTDAIDYTKLKILDVFEAATVGAGGAVGVAEGDDGEDRAHEKAPSPVAVSRGEVHLVRRVAGFKKIRYYTHENVGYGNVNLPDQEMHTTAVWWQVEPGALERVCASRIEALDGFLGVAYALHTVASVFTMSEMRDLGRAVGDGNGQWYAAVDEKGRGAIRNQSGEKVDAEALGERFAPTVFLYDNYPGGVGLSEPLFRARERLVEGARQLVAWCGCTWGCPSCVGPVLASDQVRGYSQKAAALRILDLLCGGDGDVGCVGVGAELEGEQGEQGEQGAQRGQAK